jgi:hypothetical protein
MFVEIIQQTAKDRSTGATRSDTSLLLSPHTASLCAALLPLLTELEPQAFSYMQQHMTQTASHDVQASQAAALESARVSVSTQSPVSDTLRLLVSECVTRENAVDVARVLCDSISRSASSFCVLPFFSLCPSDIFFFAFFPSGIGVPTRAGAGRFIVILCDSLHDILKEERLSAAAGAKLQSRRVFGRFTKTLLMTLTNAIQRESALVVQKQFATSLAAVCRIARHRQSVASVVDTIVSWYFPQSGKDPPKVDLRLCSAVAIGELAQKAPTAIFGKGTASAPAIGCAVFFGCVDEDKSVRTAMERTWSEVFVARGGIHDAALSRCVVDKIVEQLGASGWSMKIQVRVSFRVKVSIPPFSLRGNLTRSHAVCPCRQQTG